MLVAGDPRWRYWRHGMTDHRNTTPSDPFADGRDAKGRFGKGNPGGPGNPLVSKVMALRSAFMNAVTPEDMKEVVEAMVREAKAGNVQAQKLFIDRCLGPAEALDLLARLEELEDAVSATLGARS
ncbi:MAG: hypothetical protein ACI9OJ_000851 [Myxococcota bacterium]|jgi:hypothetical protein